ncbi:hypothetical protein GDO81_024727 [Engystomops pustulosus]|uniref:Uncharacterized protein n=1 Tax=Engystomops pustulosus TaxID=76066 RepID=A0AAV6Z5G1_ENGPU|nr:hypothetical protein GDO81_024727 [Engystomops pustulosus]
MARVPKAALRALSVGTRPLPQHTRQDSKKLPPVPSNLKDAAFSHISILSLLLGTVGRGRMSRRGRIIFGGPFSGPMILCVQRDTGKKL